MNELKATLIESGWREDPRWKGITRTYSATAVLRLRGSIEIEYTLAQMGAQRLWHLLHTESPVAALGRSPGIRRCSRSRPGSRPST